LVNYSSLQNYFANRCQRNLVQTPNSPTLNARSLKSSLAACPSGSQSVLFPFKKLFSDELRDHFNQIGPIKSLEIIKDVNTLEPRGFAFIIFDSNETYQKAIKNSQYIKGRRVECKPALSKQKAKVKACDEKGKKLFVGGLSLETTEENLVEYFKAFGEIYKTYLIYDKHKNVSRGFGFVEFKSFESSEKVTNQNEHYLDDKLIECKKILHKAEIDELRSKNPNKKKVHPCAGSDYAGLGSNGPGKSSNKTGDGTANTSPVFEQTSSGAGSQDVPQVDFSTSTNSGDLKKNSSTADPAEKFTGPENPDPNSRAYNKNYLGYPDQVAGGNSLEGWETGSYQWEADLQPQHQQYYQEHEDFYYNGFMSTEHSNSSSNYNSNSGSNYNYNSQMQQGQRGNGGFTSGLQYQNPLVNHANNAPQGLHGQQFYKPQFENHNLNVHGMQYSNMNTQDRNPMNAPNPQTFSTQHQFVFFSTKKKSLRGNSEARLIFGRPQRILTSLKML
jgi:RNA-binding protein Musashi